MSKKQGHKSNFRVVIDPRGLGNFGGISVSKNWLYGHTDADQKRMERDEEDRANEIMQDVKRHVDNVGHVSIDFDQNDVCEHCGSDWTEKSTEYNGGCCDADQAAEDERQKAKHDAVMRDQGFPEIGGAA